MEFNKQSILVGKAIVTLLWMTIAISVISPSQMPYAEVFWGIAVFLITSHFIEVIMYKRLLSTPSDYLQTMLFGLLHLKTKSKHYLAEVGS